MKKFLLSIFSLLFAFAINAQVFTSDFESWGTDTIPSGWGGSKTSFLTTEIAKYTTSAHGGVNACQLTNTATTHKRFSTSAMSVTEGQAYNINFWVRGHGSIRSGIFTGKATSAAGYMYNAYIDVNQSTWLECNQVIVADTTTTLGEFLFSIKSTNADIDHIQIDDINITISSLPTVTINEIQYSTDVSGDSPYKNQVVITSGVVTATSASAGYFIQDGPNPWHGVYVYDASHSPAEGDNLTITSTVSEYYNLTEMTNVSTYAVNSSGNSMASLEITTGDANTEQYEGMLVTVNYAQCTSGKDSYGTFEVNDGSGIINVDDVLYNGFTPVVGQYYKITGVVTYTFSEFKIFPRKASDIEVAVLNNEAEITSFSLAEQTGPATINSGAGTIDVQVFAGTSLTALVPTITISQAASINPASGVAQNFSSPVTYTVTAQDETTKNWTVTVTVSSTQNTEANIVGFDFATDIQAKDEVIDTAAATVTVTVFPDVNLTSLTPTIVLSANATINPASGTAQNFSSAFAYTVTAQNGTIKNWTVTVVKQTITPIYDIQYTTIANGDSPLKNQVVTITGIVTAIKDYSSSSGLDKGFFVADDNSSYSAIYVEAPDADYFVGDSLFITGKIAEDYNFTIMNTVESHKLINPGSTVTSNVVTVDQAGTEAYESMFVTVENVVCTVALDSYGTWGVSSATDTINVDDILVPQGAFSTLDIQIGYHYNVTGVVYYSYGEYSILPRAVNEITVLSVKDMKYENGNVYPNPFTGNIYFDINENFNQVVVYNMIGETVYNTNLNGSKTVDLSSLKEGVYFIQLFNDNQLVSSTKLVKK